MVFLVHIYKKTYSVLLQKGYIPEQQIALYKIMKPKIQILTDMYVVMCTLVLDTINSKILNKLNLKFNK